MSATVDSLLKFTAQELGKRTQMKLLWTNASPTSSFSGQTISVSGSGYDYYAVVSRVSSSVNFEVTNIFRVGCGSIISFNNSSGTTLLFNRREITGSSASSVTFGTATYNSSAGSGDDNGSCIPQKIYGIKGVS